MSMHKIPLTADEREGLKSHGLDIGTPSQLSDAFRQGMAWAAGKAAAECERLRSPTPVCLCGLRTTLNPHPDAGKPEHFLKVGALYVCIPCLNKANHGRCKEANKLRTERDAALAELAALKDGQEAVATVTISHFRQDPTMENVDFQLDAKLPCGTHKLYLAPPAQASAWVPEGLLVKHALLMWNRRHEEPPIKVGYEYGVAQAVMWLMAAPTPGASDGGGGEHE